MINKRLDLLNNSDIDSLIYNGVAENRTLEYKEKLPGNSDDDKKEFLADISSFANASGGDIIYGIREQRDSNGKTTGIPESAPGLSNINADAEIRRLEDMIRSGIAPRIVGVQTVPIDGFSEGSVIIIRIQKSWNSPHMVVYKNNSRFFSRNSAGKFQLDVTEIRSAFIASESLAERIRQFRSDRIAKIIADETPVSLKSNPKIILHILPITSFTLGTNINLRFVESNLNSLLPISFSRSLNHRYNFDGFVTFASFDHSQPSYSYSQIFRNGLIEAVEAYMLEARDGQKVIPSVYYEQQLMEPLQQYLQLQQNLEFNPPIFIMLSLLGVKGYKMYINSLYRFAEHPIDRDNLLIPEIVVEDYSAKASDILRPAFDAIWQACGYERSFNYDDNGNWIGDRR